MANISLKLLFAHWFAFLEALQRYFWNYLPQSLLSTVVLPKLAEDNSKFSPVIVHVPRFRDPTGYSNSVDLATTCLVPASFQRPLTMNHSCAVDRPGDLLDDAPSGVAPSHHYVFLETPVWPPAVSHKSKLPAQVWDDYAQTNMVTYGARGLSFCPVLVGITYIQSLLHLYMLLMIPSLVNHWLEDVLAYESLDPTELPDSSWLLYASLWVTPLYLVRLGVYKAIRRLYRYFRRVSYRSDIPPLPRIVLIRADGETVPVNLAEDHQAVADGGVWSSLESANLEMRSATFNGGEPQTSLQSPVSASESCFVGTALEGPPTQTVSRRDDAKGQVDFGLGSLTCEFARESQLFVNEGVEISLVLVEVADEPMQSIKKGAPILPIPKPDTPDTTPSDHKTDERTDRSEQEASLEDGVYDVHRVENLWDPVALDEDVTFNSRSLHDDYGSDELETSSETVSATSSSAGLQDMPILVKNVRFAVGDDANAADRWQGPLCAAPTDEYTCSPSFGGPPEDDEITLVHTPVVSSDPPTDRQDAVSSEQATEPVLPVTCDGGRVEEYDAAFTDFLLHSLTGKPIVNLPSLVTIREDLRFVEMDSMAPMALMEDAATCLPLQVLSPTTPAVVINTGYIVIVGAGEEQSPTQLGTQELDQKLPRAQHSVGWTQTLDKPATCLDPVPIREDRPSPLSPSNEDSNSVCFPILDSKPPLGDVRTLEIELSASAAVPTDTNPSAAMQVPRENEQVAETLHETPQCHTDGKDLAKSLWSELQGPEVSVLVATSPIHHPAVSESPGESSVEDQVNFVVIEKSDGTTTTLAGHLVNLSDDSATELPTAKSCEGPLASSDTGKIATSLSTISTEKDASGLDHEKSLEAETGDLLSTISKPPPERMLSGSMHAPSESLQVPETSSHTDRSSILCKTPPLADHSISLAKADEGEGGTSVVTGNTSRPRYDLSASIHAPQRTSKPKIKSSVSHSRDESDHGHRRSVTNPVVASERKQETKPCRPNWATMPEVVDAFRMFKRTPGENTIRTVSSMTEYTNRGPMLGVVGRKGNATNSLNNTSATASIQSHWTHGSGLLLVRDLVSADPADFNLRTCTNMRVSNIHGRSTVPVQQVLYPGMVDTLPYELQREIAPCTVRVNADFSAKVAGSTGTQGQQSILVPYGAEMAPTCGSQLWMAYRG